MKILTPVLFASILLLSFGQSLCAQSPQAFNYQAIARNANGDPIEDTNISLQVSILKQDTVYQEIHLGVATHSGLFTIQVGQGDFTNDDFSAINWADGDYYLKVAIDVNGGADFVDIGEKVRLLSVPFALYAENSGDTHWMKIDNTENIHYSNGRVGIGTVNPAQELHIFQNNGSNADLRLQSSGADYMDVFSGDEKGGLWIKDNRYMVLGTNNSERIRITSDGNVGIGTTNPQVKLHIVKNNGFAQVMLQRTGSNAGHSTIGGSNDGFIVGHFDNNNTYHIDFKVSHAGQAEVKTLKINGADIIEKINSTETLQPGEVIVINPANPNRVWPSKKAYDTTVLGVVSGAGGIKHGMELSQEGVLDGNVSFAIAGRVYVKVSGKVKPGDLLTTSNVKGRAMVAKNRRKSRGAIIGKALTTINEEGMVLMLVHQQ